MKYRFINFFLITGLLLSTSCFTPGTFTVIYSADYDSIEKVTNYDKYPFGHVKMPGEWILEKYDQSNRTHFYRDTNQVSVGIGMYFCSATPFYQKEMSDSTYIMEYYKWDSEYWKEQINGNARIVETDSLNNTILWNLKDDNKLNTFYLFGTRYHRSYYFYVSTDKWTDTEKISFLKTLYKNTEIYNCCENYY